MRRPLTGSHLRTPAALLFVCAVTLIVVACGPAAVTPSAGRATNAPTPRPPDLPVSTPPPAPDVPAAILAAVQAEAAQLAGLPDDQLTLVRAEPIVWPDGSLGCTQPGEMYTQALANGYWVVFRSATETFDFRVAEDGSFTRCEQLAPVGS